MAKASSKKMRKLVQVWQTRAEEIARLNPGRSKGWVADQIAKEEISNGHPSHLIRSNINLDGYTEGKRGQPTVSVPAFLPKGVIHGWPPI